MTSSPSAYEGWESDELPSTYRFLRRLGAKDVQPNESGGLRIKTSGFQPHRESQAISITIVEIAEQLGLEAMEAVLNSPSPADAAARLPGRDDYGICGGTLADIRAVGLNVRLMAEPWNPAHAVLYGQSKSNTRKLGGQLCRRCELIVLPAPHRDHGS